MGGDRGHNERHATVTSYVVHCTQPIFTTFELEDQVGI